VQQTYLYQLLRPALPVHADPSATSGNLTVACTGRFDTTTPVRLLLSIQAAQPRCSRPAILSASTVIPFVCCLIAPLSSPAVALFNTGLACQACNGSAVLYASEIGRSPTGPLMAQLGSECRADGSSLSNPGVSTGAFASVGCNNNDNRVVSFRVIAPAYSQLSVSFAIRCRLASMALKCPDFVSLSSLNPDYHNIQEANAVSGYSLTWQVRLTDILSSCNCTSAAVSVQASGIFTC